MKLTRITDEDLQEFRQEGGISHSWLKRDVAQAQLDSCQKQVDELVGEIISNMEDEHHRNYQWLQAFKHKFVVKETKDGT